jgi:hypothetical protein
MELINDSAAISFYKTYVATGAESVIARAIGDKLVRTIDSLLEEGDLTSRELIMRAVRLSPLLYRSGEEIILSPHIPEDAPEYSSGIVLEQLEDWKIYSPSRKQFVILFEDYKTRFLLDTPEKIGGACKVMTCESYKAAYRKLRRLWFFAFEWVELTRYRKLIA